MERAARSTSFQVACFGLLAAALNACATIQEPPGGPPDFEAPVILSITPDSGSIVPGFDDAIEVQFDEVIDEGSGTTLRDLVVLSPRPEELRVSWRRTRITIKPRRGWRDSIVYQMKLLPGFSDLRRNRLDTGRTVVFSTGGEIPDTRISGTAIDWEAGSAASGALVEAVLMPDSLVFIASSDSVGDFEVKHLKPGSYVLFTTLDNNNNGMRDYREAFDSVVVQLDSSLNEVLWTFTHDTVGPRVSGLTELDSITFQIDFTQKLAPDQPSDTSVSVFSLPDTTRLETVAIWNQLTYDSVRIEEQRLDSLRQAAIADSIRAAEAAAAEAADTLEGVVGDTGVAEVAEEAAVADSLVGELLQPVDSTGQIPGDSAVADTSRATLLLTERDPLSESLYVRMPAALVPGARYLVTTWAQNVAGAVAESQGLLVLPEAVDTSEVPTDSTLVPPDST